MGDDVGNYVGNGDNGGDDVGNNAGKGDGRDACREGGVGLLAEDTTAAAAAAAAAASAVAATAAAAAAAAYCRGRLLFIVKIFCVVFKEFARSRLPSYSCHA